MRNSRRFRDCAILLARLRIVGTGQETEKKLKSTETRSTSTTTTVTAASVTNIARPYRVPVDLVPRSAHSRRVISDLEERIDIITETILRAASQESEAGFITNAIMLRAQLLLVLAVLLNGGLISLGFDFSMRD